MMQCFPNSCCHCKPNIASIWYEVLCQGKKTSLTEWAYDPKGSITLEYTDSAKPFSIYNTFAGM